MVVRPLPWLVAFTLTLGAILPAACSKPAPPEEHVPEPAMPEVKVTPDGVAAEFTDDHSLADDALSTATLTTGTLPLSDDAHATPSATPLPPDILTTETLQGDSPATATLPLEQTGATTASASTAPTDASVLVSDASELTVVDATKPRKERRRSLKRVLLPAARVIELEEANTLLASAAKQDAESTSGTAKDAKPPSATTSLRAYLLKELGPKKYHTRAKWAGGGFEPVVVGKRVWKPLGPIRYVTIHHADGVPDEHPARMIRNIYTGHTTLGGRLNAPDIGYHFFVDRNGEVWEGRDASKQGTHVGSKPAGLNNAGNIGICGLGTFKGENPPRKMVETMVQLSVLIAKYSGREVTVRGHKDWLNINEFHPYGGCDCPGRLQAAVKRARTEVRAAMAKPKPAAETKLAESEKPRPDAKTAANDAAKDTQQAAAPEQPKSEKVAAVAE